MSVRREPPSYQPATITRRDLLSPRMMRVTLAGVSIPPPELAASVRVLLDTAVMPRWNGNEFLLPDGSRPLIRTLTPRFVRDGELDVDVVLHGDSPLTRWARSAADGAVSGPGRGYVLDPAATSFVLAGDETALPAISQLLERITAPVVAMVELAHPDGRQPLGIDWLGPGGLVSAVRDAALTPGTKVWVAAEAAAAQRIRKYVFEERGLPRSDAWIRGYWSATRRPDQS